LNVSSQYFVVNYSNKLCLLWDTLIEFLIYSIRWIFKSSEKHSKPTKCRYLFTSRSRES